MRDAAAEEERKRREEARRRQEEAAASARLQAEAAEAATRLQAGIARQAMARPPAQFRQPPQLDTGVLGRPSIRQQARQMLGADESVFGGFVRGLEATGRALDIPRQRVGLPLARRIIPGDVPVASAVRAVGTAMMPAAGLPLLGAEAYQLATGRGPKIPERIAEEGLSMVLDPMNLAPGIGYGGDIARAVRRLPATRTALAARAGIGRYADDVVQAAPGAARAGVEPFGLARPQAVTAAREVPQEIRVGDFIKSKPGGAFIAGQVVGEGELGTRKLPAWKIDAGGGRITAVPKDDAVFWSRPFERPIETAGPLLERVPTSRALTQPIEINATLVPPKPASFVTEHLGRKGTGAPGLTTESFPASPELGIGQRYEITYRNTKGKPIGYMELVGTRSGLTAETMVTDQSAGLLRGRAAQALAQEAQRLGVTNIGGTMTPDVQRFVEGLQKRGLLVRKTPPEPAGPLLERGAAEAPASDVARLSRPELLDENRRLKTLIQEGRGTAADEERIVQVRAALQGAPAEAPLPPDVPLTREDFTRRARGLPPSEAPPPPREPPTAAGGMPPQEPPIKPPRERTLPPDDIGERINQAAMKGERPDQTLIRLHEASIATAKTEGRVFVEQGNSKLLKAKLGQRFQGSVVGKADSEMDDLFDALHNVSRVEKGEIAVPEHLRPIYDDLRNWTDLEQAARLDFDPEMAQVSDYFYRGWKPPEGMFAGGGKGPLVKTPAFKKPRVDATYREMREAGFEPLSWNPYEQAEISRMMGVRYREQMRLIDDMKQLELAKPHAGGPLPEGWRVPEVGPAFEGKPFAILNEAGDPIPMFTKRWVVPDNLADTLENVYGKAPKLGAVEVAGKRIDMLKAIDALVFLPKRAKLFGSFFQQIDFLTRSGIGSWHGMVNALRTGHPLEAVTHLAKYPPSAAKILTSYFSPAYRNALRRELLDTTPLLKQRPGLTMQAVSKAGLSVQDVTILPADIDKVVREVAKEALATKAVKVPGRALASVERGMRRGLFNGVYPAAVLTDVRNNIAPLMVRYHPDATDAQLAGYIAKAANTRYSTIPASQSVIQNRFVRETARRMFFSINESEGLLRQATGAIRGPNAAFWREQALGAFLFLTATANVIHYAATGKPLPLDRYSPIAKDKWGPLPFGYNRDFASPDIPLTGRSGSKLTLDLVGQMDTALRVLDPASFISSRESVPVRAAVNQLKGKDFYGADIDTVGPEGIVSRTAQLIFDVAAPIGIGQAAMEAARNKIEGAERIIPPGESRLGITGSLIQASGVNLRAETTQKLLDRWAQESGLQKPDGTPVNQWADLSPSQKNMAEQDSQLQEELKLRSEEAVLRDQGKAEGFAALEETETRRLEEETRAVERYQRTGDGEEFRQMLDGIQAQAAIERSQVDRDYQLFKTSKEMPTDPYKRALMEYYNVFDKARLPGGKMDYELLDSEMVRLEGSWTPSQKAYIEENTGLAKHVPEAQKMYDARELLDTMPSKYKGVTAERAREIDKFVWATDEVPAAAIKYADKFGHRISEKVVAQALAQQKGDPDLYRWYVNLRNEKKREALLNPEYDRFLKANYATLSTFYPWFYDTPSEMERLGFLKPAPSFGRLEKMQRAERLRKMTRTEQLEAAQDARDLAAIGRLGGI